MNLTEFLQRLQTRPEGIEFNETIALIDSLYQFTPGAFRNGELDNSAEQNQGSCKIFAFAELQGFDREQTLACFGAYYRDQVLARPEGQDHQNIRQFMLHGWDGITFLQKPLVALNFSTATTGFCA